MSNQIVLSVNEVKRLIEEEGYHRYQHQCKEADDKSIQEHYGLTTDEMKDLLSDSRLQYLRRKKKKRTISFIEDDPSLTLSSIEELKSSEIEEETEEVITYEVDLSTSYDEPVIEVENTVEEVVDPIAEVNFSSEYNENDSVTNTIFEDDSWVDDNEWNDSDDSNTSENEFSISSF